MRFQKLMPYDVVNLLSAADYPHYPNYPKALFYHKVTFQELCGATK